MTCRSVELNGLHRRSYVVTRVLAAATAVFLGGCVTTPVVEERAASAPVDPIERMTPEIGQVFGYEAVEGEKTFDYEVLDVMDDGSFIARQSNNCQWETPADRFSPGAYWKGCGSGDWSDGRRTITSSSGDPLWPLRAGTSAKWTFSMKNSQGEGNDRNTRRCSVSGPVAISVKIGDVMP